MIEDSYLRVLMAIIMTSLHFHRYLLLKCLTFIFIRMLIIVPFPKS